MTDEELKTPDEWDEDPRNGYRVISWSDFGRNAYAEGIGKTSLITWEEFRRCRRGATVGLKPGFTYETADGISDG